MADLYYFVDPMCSWCYGFSVEMKKIVDQLPEEIELHYVMGGLAPDSDEPMPAEMQAAIQHHWQAVAEKTGAAFNFDFWSECEPMRSTYPSCRAVVAASLQDESKVATMLEAVHHAYYRQARNPSLDETLIEVAGEIGLDTDQFRTDLNSSQVEERLQADFVFKYRLGIQGFPTLVLQKEDSYYALTIGYTRAEVVLERLAMVLEDRLPEQA